MLEPIRTVRVLAILVIAQGAFVLLFWKILAIVIATASSRYNNFTGKMAKALFAQDKALVQLMQTGDAFLTPLFILGLLISILGISIIAFPNQALQILRALKIFK